MEDFSGAKLAILSGSRIVTILRDDSPAIPWPGFWDLPGGGREGSETPEDCVLRELCEELGLTISPDDLHWRIRSPSPGGGHVWFFVSEQPDFAPETVCFGNEGQAWALREIDWFLNRGKTIPQHRKRLKLYLKSRPARP